MWRTVGENIASYHGYPRLVGETGGKDFILAHPSADPDAVATAIVRGSFEYQGQKCSASSRLYIPSNLWPEVRDRLQTDVSSIAMGDVRDFTNFMGAVIDGASFETQADAIAEAREAGAEIVAGGGTDDSKGWFVEPTVIKTDDPRFRLMRDELFGPVVTPTSTTRRTGTTRCASSTRLRRTPSPAPSSRTTATRSTRHSTSSATRPATSTSTTSPPAPSSASSRSAARAPRARTTRRDRCGT